MDFENTYSFSPNLAMVKFYQSVYYFSQKNYSSALKVMNSIKNRYLPQAQRLEFVYNRAYSYMREGDFNRAIDGFDKIVSSEKNKYSLPSLYYLGYVYYLTKDFEMAISLFSKLLDDARYSSLSRYFLLESHFMLSDYDYVLEMGDQVHRVVRDEFKPKVARIISEAYFKLDMPKQANDYFELYSSSTASLSRKDNYYSGVVSYTLNSYYSAIDAFSKLLSEKDSLSQSAYNYIGNSYLKIKNKHKALEAFRSASEMAFDPILTEETMFLYAKLAFDLNSDISVFNRYLKRFPSSVKSDEIYNYIGTAFILKKNYRAAIYALAEIKNKEPYMVRNLQKAAFFRSMQLFERGSYRAEIIDFKIALKFGSFNRALYDLSSFWLAEAYYRTDIFKESIDINLGLVKSSRFRKTREYPMALYNLGYSYFRLNDFDNAILWFRQYLAMQPSKMTMVVEANTRLADSYFMNKEYSRSAEIYHKIALASYQVDDIYARFQAAVSYGLISQEDKKIGMLKSIIEEKPNSPLFSKSVYELGRTYVQVEDDSSAVGCFTQLVNDVRDSVYYSKSLLELGMINSNHENYDRAIEYFSVILEDIPLSEDVPSALIGVETIYQIRNMPQEFLTYLDGIGMSSVKTADEKQIMLFNSAEQMFLAENYVDAQDALTTFIQKYPDAEKTSHAYFYLGNTLSSLNKPEAAADAYKEVMIKGDGAFAELATLYYGKICYQLELYQESVLAFEALLEIARLDNNKYEALLWRMRSYFKFEDYEKAIVSVQEFLASQKGVDDSSIEAKYILAKSHLLLGERLEAIPILRELFDEPLTPEGAEGAYLLILDAYDEGEFDVVEKMVYTFSDSETPQTYWLAKSFIVLGDSFAERQEWEQALATYNSVKEGYSPMLKHDDVLEQVEIRLNRISSKISN